MPVEHYAVYVKTGTFAIRKMGRQALERIRLNATWLEKNRSQLVGWLG